MEKTKKQIQCGACPHCCALAPEQAGLCGVRKNKGGRIISTGYGKITSMALDPIEKKPLAYYLPGSRILSVGSFGCNLACPFCQNYGISMARESQENGSILSPDGEISAEFIAPEELAEVSRSLIPQGNIGVAYTYNEPLTAYEYVRDCAAEVRKRGMKNVLVTNGCFNEEVRRQILPLMDACNIDLKGFTEAFYRKLGGDLETVKAFICEAAEAAHIEITTLIVPGENDTEEELQALSAWLAALDPSIPLHITRFFPRYRYAERDATDIRQMHRLAAIARQNLSRVQLGNI